MSSGIVVCVAVVCVTEVHYARIEKVGYDYRSKCVANAASSFGMICDIEKAESMFELDFPEPLR